MSGFRYPIETHEHCSVESRDGGNGPIPNGTKASSGSLRKLKDVTVRRTANNTFEFTRPRSREVIEKRITGRHVKVTDDKGIDLIAYWRRTMGDDKLTRKLEREQGNARTYVHIPRFIDAAPIEPHEAGDNDATPIL